MENTTPPAIEKRAFAYDSVSQDGAKLFVFVQNIEDEEERDGAPIELSYDYFFYSVDTDGVVQFIDTGLAFDDPNFTVFREEHEKQYKEEFVGFEYAGEVEYSLMADLQERSETYPCPVRPFNLCSDWEQRYVYEKGPRGFVLTGKRTNPDNSGPIERKPGFFERLFGKRN